MFKRPAFSVNGVVLKGAEKLSIKSIHPAINQIVLEGFSGEIFNYSTDDFNTLVAKGEFKILPVNAVGGDFPFPERCLTLTERCALDNRLEVLELVDKHLQQQEPWAHIARDVQALCESRGWKNPSVRTLQRWRATRARSSSTAQVAPYYSLRGQRLRHSPNYFDFEDIVMDEISLRYAKSDKFNFSQVTKLINDRLRQRSIQMGTEFKGLSRRSVRRRIQNLDYRAITQGQVTQETFNQQMRGAIEPFLVQRPYERVEMDATPLDIFCRDDAGNIIGKPTLYAAIDSASGASMGITCSIQKSSQLLALQTLQFCFAPKGEAFTQKYQLRNPWPAPANFSSVVLDNAAEHHGGGALNALRYLNISFEYSRAKKPQQKPFIERFFGSLKTALINTMPGSTNSQSKIEKDANRKAASQNLLTVAQLEAYIIRWAADVYMQTPNPRLENRFGAGCCPAQALDRLKKEYFVCPPPGPQEFKDACLQYFPREATLDHSGVRCEGMGFNSSELHRLYQELGPKQKVQIRVYPLDCTFVYVVHPRQRDQLIIAYNKTPGMPPISFEEAAGIRRKLKKSDAELSGEHYHLNHVQLLREIDEQSKSGKMRDANKAARVLDRKSVAVKKTEPSTVPVIPRMLIAAPRRQKGDQQ
ncbi:Mu transposase C-terminal domain-containing protein [Pseudomonas hormoni]